MKGQAAGGSPFAPRVFDVEGEASAAEYARFRPQAIVELLAAPAAMERARALTVAHGLTVPVRARARAPEEGGDGARQSPIAARVRLKATEPDAFWRRIESRPRDLVLALDHVLDPRNLGAIVRSAAFFGVREVLVPERRQVLLTQASVATAQGGFALTDLVCVVNLARTLTELKDRGYWVIGAAQGGERVAAILAADYEKTVLVLGSEETGLSRGVRELCDRLAGIPGRDGGLESLNVSVAAGILLARFSASD